MSFIEIFKKKPAQSTFRQITINTTRFSVWDFDTNTSYCKTCKKTNQIIAGLPDSLTVTVPIADYLMPILYEKLFYISGDFELVCVNGVSHIATGLAKGRRWIVSSEQDVTKGVFEAGVGFEQTLAAFLPKFYEYLIARERLLPERLGDTPKYVNS
jgi:hypothetical protein